MIERYRLGCEERVGRIADMNAMILSFVLVSQVLSQALVAQVESLPGNAYSIPAKGVTLHSDAGQDFPAVFSLEGQSVVRIGALKGVYREVFVPQGFAVYMHRDYLQLDDSDGTATVTGDRVNMRLLPGTDGAPTVGQLSRPTGPLVILPEPAGDWVRLVAPVQVPLYALDTEVPTPPPPSAGARSTRHARRAGSRRLRPGAAPTPSCSARASCSRPSRRSRRWTSPS
jgi:hypothetical protein